MNKPWQILTQLPNGDEISTVRLPEQFYRNRWESCLFRQDGSSEVITIYDSEVAAIRGHSFLVAHEVMHDVAKMQHSEA